jgi:hypothetical protein
MHTLTRIRAAAFGRTAALRRQSRTLRLRQILAATGTRPNNRCSGASVFKTN